MSNQPAFNYSSLKQKTETSDVSSPFWVKPKSNFSKAKAIFKQIWKWAKIAILLFFFVMGLWGCFQTTFDTKVASSTTIGSGLEFGFIFGTTGDWRYDLCGSPYQQLHIGGLNALLAIFVLILIIRVITTAATIKSTIQNEKMSEVSGKLSEINAKYKGLKDTQSKQMKQQEIMELYKKNNVRPFAAFEQILITLPIFLIVYRVVTILRPLKATVLFGIWNFSYAPLTTIFNSFLNGGWAYIFFILIVVPVQFLSTWLPQYWAKKRNRNATTSSQKGQKENRKRQIFQYVFAGVMSLIVVFTPCGVGVYWFFNAMLAILQSFIMHRIIVAQRKHKFKQNVGNITIS